MSTDDKTSTSIDGSTQKSTDVSSCDLVPDVDGEITMVDFLKLEYEAQQENLDQNLEKKLVDHQHTSEEDLNTSLEASIDRYPHDCIYRHPPYIIDQQKPYIINHHPPDSIDLHSPDCIDRHPWLDELPGYVVELKQDEERMYMSKALHLAVPKHWRPPIWTEEAAGFHKRVKRIHDPVKVVVPCVVFEAESPIPPDRSMQFSSYNEVLDNHKHVEASHRGLRFRDEVDKGPAEAASIDTDRIPSIDTTTSPSIDTTLSSIDSGRVSEHKEFDVHVDREITMEDFLELEEFWELEDGEKLEDLDSGGEVTMEDSLELEE
ncbi:hypothetical protein F2Q70_00044390 [Brassica cretica]|uniref:Uncharacterized protein n=1 Tax=Brassica cretica TaxID=69181 RepID=A0A8S9KJI9_BRACR|nr:hypothetical protein F2Q70_00044390 [Brassica cretica]